MSIGTNIYTLRKEKKITQGQLAEKLGVSEQSVSKWENDLCAPDVSLLPIIAGYFGVSIDRIFGYHMNSYAEEVRRIVQAADDSMDTYAEIEIMEEGLARYPNSPELKIYLAFSLSMVNRISPDAVERNEAVQKAVRLCREVIDTCGDAKQVDDALHMLRRIYTETGEYERADECLARISAERYDSRVVGRVQLLGCKKSYTEQQQYGAQALWKLYWTMSYVFEHMTHSLMQTGDYEKAAAFADAHEILLSVFDAGCPDFYTTYKMDACLAKARAHMAAGDKERSLAALKRFFVLAEQAKTVAASPDFNIAVRNPLYFSCITEEILEEYAPEVHPERILPKFDAFFAGDAAYQQFKKETLA